MFTEDMVGTVGLCYPFCLCQGKSEEMLWANLLDLLPGNRDRDLNLKPRSAHWSLIRNVARRQGPKSQHMTLLHKDRLALWVKFYLLLFREDKLSAMGHSLPFTFY